MDTSLIGVCVCVCVCASMHCFQFSPHHPAVCAKLHTLLDGVVMVSVATQYTVRSMVEGDVTRAMSPIAGLKCGAAGGRGSMDHGLRVVGGTEAHYGSHPWLVSLTQGWLLC